MPCAKRMAGCKRNCQHRRMVQDYQAARHAQVLAEEARTLGGDGEREIERQNYVPPPITFKEWLVGNRGMEEEECTQGGF